VQEVRVSLASCLSIVAVVSVRAWSISATFPLVFVVEVVILVVDNVVLFMCNDAAEESHNGFKLKLHTVLSILEKPLGTRHDVNLPRVGGLEVGSSELA
jgi:hypothetical protein